MKYSEYLQLRDILDENDISWEDYQKDPKLYEGILGKIGQGIWNLAKKGMSKAISAGLQPSQREKLNKKAEQIKNWVVEEIEKAQKDENHELNKFLQKRKELIKVDKEGKQYIPGGNRQSVKVLDREINKYIRKNVDLQTKKVDKAIDKQTMIDEEGKEILHDYWEQLETQIELSIAMSLNKMGIIGEDAIDDLAKVLSGQKPLGYGNEEPDDSVNNEKK